MPRIFPASYLPEKIAIFPHLKEAPPRAGFVQEPQYKQLAANVDELWLRALLATAHAFGFRKSELLNVLVRQINLIDHTKRLDPGTTKNDEGHVVVMTSNVLVPLQAYCVAKDPDAFGFTRPSGNPVRVFRDDWEALCCRGGLGRIACPGCCPATTVDGERRCPHVLRHGRHTNHDTSVYSSTICDEAR